MNEFDPLKIETINTKTQALTVDEFVLGFMENFGRFNIFINVIDATIISYMVERIQREFHKNGSI